MLKYQETIQRLGAAGGEEIVLSECKIGVIQVCTTWTERGSCWIRMATIS